MRSRAARWPGGLRTTLRIGRPGAGIFVFLVVFIGVVSLFTPQILSAGNLASILNQMVFILIPTMGMTIVIVAGGIDLSVGSTIGMTGGVCAFLMSSGTPMPVAFAAAILAGAVVGAINEIVITQLKVPDFVATLAMLGVLRGLLYVWTNGIPFRNYMTPSYYAIGGLRMVAFNLTIPVFVAAAILVVLSFLLRRTYLGPHFRDGQQSRGGAPVGGIQPEKIKRISSIASGALAGVTGVLLAGRSSGPFIRQWARDMNCKSSRQPSWAAPRSQAAAARSRRRLSLAR